MQIESTVKLERGQQWESTREPGRVVTILEVMDQTNNEKHYVLAEGNKSKRKSKISIKELTGRFKKLEPIVIKTEGE